MGQSNSKQIIQKARLLQTKQILSLQQVQKFITDLKRDQPLLRQVKQFKDNQLQLFLKYFIPFHYPSTLTESSQYSISVKHNNTIQGQIQARALLGTQKKYKRKYAIIKENCQLIRQAVSGAFLNKEKTHFYEQVKQLIHQMIGIDQFEYICVKSDRTAIKYKSNTNNLKYLKQGFVNRINRKVQQISEFNVHFQYLNSQFLQIFQEQKCQKSQSIYKNQKNSLTQIHIENNRFIIKIKHSKHYSYLKPNKHFLKQWKKFIKLLILQSFNHQTKCNLSSHQYQQTTTKRCQDFISLCISSIKLQYLYLKEKLIQKFQVYENMQADFLSNIFHKIKKIKKYNSSDELQKFSNLTLASIEQYQNYFLKVIKKLQVYQKQIGKNLQQLFIQINKYHQITFINCNIRKLFPNIQNKQFKQIKCSDIFPQNNKVLDILQRYQNGSFNNQKQDFSQQNFLVQTFFNDNQKLDEVHVRISLSKNQKLNNYYLKQLKVSNFPLSQITNKNFGPKLTAKIHSSIHSLKQLNQIKEQFINPDFNAFNLKQSHFFYFIEQLLSQLNFSKKIPKINYTKLSSFLNNLQLNYEKSNNPFHNFKHGINVMQTSYLILNMAKKDNILSDLSKFTVVFSALCHDVGHTGYSNAFQITTLSQKATMFNDISPLQNYHIFLTLSLLKNQQHNFLDFLSMKEYAQFRKLLISNILYTDVKQHFSLIKSFQQYKLCQKFEQGSQAEKIFCGMVMHTSDFGGSAKQFKISQQWSKKVNQQFSLQSLKQKQLGLIQSPFMLNLDNKKILSRNQFNFLKIIVQPLFKCLDDFFNVQNSKILLNYIQKNMKRWQQGIKDSEKSEIKQ